MRRLSEELTAITRDSNRAHPEGKPGTNSQILRNISIDGARWVLATYFPHTKGKWKYESHNQQLVTLLIKLLIPTRPPLEALRKLLLLHTKQFARFKSNAEPLACSVLFLHVSTIQGIVYTRNLLHSRPASSVS